VTLTRADGVRLPVRREIAALVAYLCDATEAKGYDLRAGWCWGYACRKIRGSSTWSNHAWGLAVDLNAPENPMGPRNGRIRRYPAAIALWKNYGFRWGGDYSGRADDMHFEFMGTPRDAAAFTEFAKKNLGKPKGVFMALTDAEQKELLEKVRTLHVAIAAKDDAAVKEATGRSTGGVMSNLYRIVKHFNINGPADDGT
jgi:hypothetical protein